MEVGKDYKIWYDDGRSIIEKRGKIISLNGNFVSLELDKKFHNKKKIDNLNILRIVRYEEISFPVKARCLYEEVDQ